MAEYFFIKSSVIRFACQRIGLLYSEVALKPNLKNLQKEDNGFVKLTMHQLEALSKILKYPLTYLMLKEPVTDIDDLPIADFRTVSNSKVHSSITLCEQIEYCQNQQQWFSDYVKDDYEPFSLIGKFKTFESAEAAANKARLALGITFKGFKDPKKYLANIKEKLEENLILVSISKVLKNTTTRLQLSEFRGFALTDSYAPFVFINGNDALSAQIFTLCHELGHICLGLSGVSDVSSKNKAVPEIWCNEFAANFLMPKEEFSNDFKNADFLDDFIEFAKGKYFVSSLAILIRLYNLNLISKECFNESFAKAKAQYQKLLSSKLENKESSGGNYYRTVGSRLSALLTRTLIDATSVGKTTFRDATYLLGLGSVSVFDKLAKRY